MIMIFNPRVLPSEPFSPIFYTQSGASYSCKKSSQCNFPILVIWAANTLYRYDMNGINRFKHLTDNRECSRALQYIICHEHGKCEKHRETYRDFPGFFLALTP